MDLVGSALISKPERRRDSPVSRLGLSAESPLQAMAAVAAIRSARQRQGDKLHDSPKGVGLCAAAGTVTGSGAASAGYLAPSKHLGDEGGLVLRDALSVE